MDSTTQFLAILIILAIFLINAVNIVVRRRGRLPMRRLSAVDNIPIESAASVETANPLLISFGNVAPGTGSTMLALASADIGAYAAQSAAYSTAKPIVTTSNTVAVPLATNTLQRAYAMRDRLSFFEPVQARWYPDNGQALLFAAAMTAVETDDRAGANVLVGRFGAELALIAHAAKRGNRHVIAGSDQLDGQAVAYAMADDALIGEEIFAVPGYLSPQPYLAHRNITIDIARGLLVAVIVVLTIVAILNGN